MPSNTKNTTAKGLIRMLQQILEDNGLDDAEIVLAKDEEWNDLWPLDDIEVVPLEDLSNARPRAKGTAFVLSPAEGRHLG